MKGINIPGQALDSGGVASFSAPRDGVSHLAFPALARERNCERQEEKARAENLHQLLFDPGIFMDAELDLGFGEDDDEH
ncbi:MAG: hypothetical protein H0S77_07110 [Spirochaetaceae bacterium]|jgi:hypothetical protein|nr:hypothetical protein [Spirochaetaceae bacterium]